MSDTIARMMDMSIFGCRNAQSVWGAIPPEKTTFYQAADMVIQKANVYREYEADENATEDSQTFSLGGQAERFIMTFKAFCVAFGMEERDAIGVVQGISDWFEKRGWTHCRLPFATVYESALEDWDKVTVLRNERKQQVAALKSRRQ